MESGLPAKVASTLTEEQISQLHSRLFTEAVTQTTTTSYNIPTSDAERGVTVPVPAGKKMSIQKTPLGVKATPTEEMSEEKDSKKNPWAICHAKLGPRKNAKFESCVKQVKKSLEESENRLSLAIENRIMELLETHLPPKITKKDLLQYLQESPEVAPSKPKTEPKPGTKEPTKPSKNPNPFKNPRPNVKPAPQAKTKNKEVKEDSPVIAPSKPKTQPKPGTKEPTKPSKNPNPFKNPRPNVKPAPQAITPEEAKEKIIDTIMQILQNEKN